MIDVSSLIGDIPTTSITVRTYAASTRDAYGRTTDGAPTDTVETAVVHPATSRRMLERLPEAGRQRETIAVYVIAASTLTGANTSRPPRVLYGGRWYERSHIGDYGAMGGILLVLASLIDAVS